MKKSIIILFLTASLCCAQGVSVSSSMSPVTNSQGQPIANVALGVCTAANTIPPTCGTPVTVYQNVTLTTPYNSGNPLVTDGFGNFYFFIAPSSNPYCYTTTAPAITGMACQIFSAVIAPGSSPTFTGITTSKVDGFYYVDGVTFTTVQSAITAACSATPAGGTVYISTGSFAQNTPFTLCSNLNIIGTGRCQVDATNCPTMITTTMTSGDLFPITNMTDIHLADFGIKNTAAAGANAAIRLNYGQRVVAERLYISGLFARGIELDTSSTSSGSTIRNHFEDIFMTGLAPSSIGCYLNSADATNKVINSNRFVMVACQGGTGASVGLKVANTNTTQNINENFFYGDEFATADGSGGTGIGIQFTSTATRGMTFISPNVESNGTGLNKATANTVSFFGGNFSSNGTNVTDSQPTFSQFIGTNVGGTVQQFSVNPLGDINADGIGLKATPDPGNINGLTGWVLEASGTTVAALNSSEPKFLGNGLVVGTNTVHLNGGFTSANSSALQPITGLTIPLGSTSHSYSFHCSLIYSQATNVAGDQLGIASLTTAPTNLLASARVDTSTTAFIEGSVGITDTSPHAIVTFQPGSAGTFIATIDGTVEPSGSGASTLQWYVLNGTAADVIVIGRGSYCSVAP